MTTGLGQDRRRLLEQAEQARRDLDDLEVQVAGGEIEEESARRLRAVYRRELETAEEGLRRTEEAAAAPGRSPKRMVAGGALLVLALAVTVGLVGQSVQEREDGPLEGVAAGDRFDPEAYSDETLEAVVAAYADDPAVADQLQFMRFALAERYFERQEYQRAFPHYQSILEGEPPPDLAAAALSRVAWIVWAGNDELDLALSLVGRALEAVPGHPEATYLEGRLLWCGKGDAPAGAERFERVLADHGLDPEVAAQIEADLAVARAGGACP